MSREKSPTTQIGYWLLTCALLCLAPKFTWGSVQDSKTRPKAWTGSDPTSSGSFLKIYLPREVTIPAPSTSSGRALSEVEGQDNHFKLGQISIIRGEESLVAKASNITLGQISVPGQRIVVDRSTALSRLACNGIPASKVTLIGAEKVTVQKQHQVIKGREFVELASSFLKKTLPMSFGIGSACQFSPVWIPKDLILPGLSKDVRLSPRLVQSPDVHREAKVQIAVFSEGGEIGVREVTFRLKYNCRTIVTLVEIPAGAVISPENVKIEKTVSNYPEPINWRPSYGLIARRRIPAETVIRPDMVGPAEPAIVVGRNETVVIQIKRPGLLITALGKAMQEGRSGEYIKVRNLDSQRIILTKVNEDGTVEPIF